MREGGGNVVEIVFVDGDALLRRLQGVERRLQFVRAQGLPEFRTRGDPLEGVGQLRIEPGSGAMPHFLAAASMPAPT